MNVHTKPGKRQARAKPAAAKAAPAAVAASPIAPDCSGQDFYAIDAGLQQLLALYLPADTRAQLEPHFARLGVLAGGRLDELARTADANGPVLHPRDRFGRDEDWIEYHPSYREMEAIAFGDFQFHAMSHRAGTLGLDAPLPPVAKYACQYLFVQGEFGIMCPISVTDTSIYLLRKYASPELKDYLLPQDAVGRSGRAMEGHAVHDREGRRLRHRPRRDHRPQRGRHLASLRRQVVLLARRRRRGPHAGPARRGAGGHPGPCPVRPAATARGRLAQQLPDRAAEGQARHPLHGLGRDQAGGRRRLSGRPARPGPQADDGPGQPVAPFARRARRRHDAPLRQRGAHRGAPSRRLRQGHHRAPAAAPPADETDGAGRAGAIHDHGRRGRHGRSGCGLGRGRRGAAYPHPARQVPRLPRQRHGRHRRHGGARRQRLHRGVGQRPPDPRRPGRPAVGGHQQHQRARRDRPRRRQVTGAQAAGGAAARPPEGDSWACRPPSTAASSRLCRGRCNSPSGWRASPLPSRRPGARRRPFITLPAPCCWPGKARAIRPTLAARCSPASCWSTACHPRTRWSPRQAAWEAPAIAALLEDAPVPLARASSLLAAS